MLILPAIDLLGGRCVRLAQGDYGREKVYSEDPVATAQGFTDEGAEWLHLVDLDGAKSGDPTNLHLVEAIAHRTTLKIEFGGGVRNEETIARALSAGVTRVVLGSVLIKNPEFAAAAFGRFGEQIVAGIDAREGRVAVSGWLDTSEVSAADLAVAMAAKGAKRIILTDIARDGMLTGPNLDLLREVSAACGLPMIQSGGISSLEDLTTLSRMGAEAPEGVIVGRAIYEGKFSVKEAIQLGL